MVRALSWEELEVKEDKLKELQKKNLPLILEAFEKLGYEVVTYEEVGDGWMTGFTIYEFTCRDKRDSFIRKENTYKFTGSDDNLAIYEVYESGGRGLFKRVMEVLKK